MKTYIKTLAFAFAIALVLGLLGPFLLSQRDDFAVALGFVLLALLPPALFYILRFGSKRKTKRDTK